MCLEVEWSDLFLLNCWRKIELDWCVYERVGPWVIRHPHERVLLVTESSANFAFRLTAVFVLWIFLQSTLSLPHLPLPPSQPPSSPPPPYSFWGGSVGETWVVFCPLHQTARPPVSQTGTRGTDHRKAPFRTTMWQNFLQHCCNASKRWGRKGWVTAVWLCGSLWTHTHTHTHTQVYTQLMTNR